MITVPFPFEVFRQYFVPQHALTRFAGLLANNKIPWIKNLLIRYFLGRFTVSMDEAQESDPFAYESFNAFFTRRLKSNARPISQYPNTICSPADGTLYQHGSIDNHTLLKAKRHDYTLTALLGVKDEFIARFANGYYQCIYLAPHNYHRVHIPVEGTLLKMRYIPGRLFSVNSTTAEFVPNLFARNERVVLFFKGDKGYFSVILVGAMIVGSISTPWAGQIAPANLRQVSEFDYKNSPIHFKKGEEIGCFSLGSTAIVLFDQKMKVDECFDTDPEVIMGEKLGTFIEG